MGAPLRSLRFRSDRGPLSRWLARRGLDQLPELLNVLRGEMALVGPSPVPRAIVTLWTELVPEAGRRFNVLPGVTGLAQLSGDSEEDVGALVRRAALDLDYIERRSAWLDLAILARAAGHVIAPPPAPPRPAAQQRPGPAPAKAVRPGVPPRTPRARMKRGERAQGPKDFTPLRRSRSGVEKLWGTSLSESRAARECRRTSPPTSSSVQMPRSPGRILIFSRSILATIPGAKRLETVKFFGALFPAPWSAPT